MQMLQPLSDSDKRKLIQVRAIAENLMGLRDLLTEGLDEDNRPTEIDLLLNQTANLMDQAAWAIAGLPSEGMGYDDIIDYCTGELGEEMDGSDE